jgi:5-methylcytosine-specific restriction endonuclease McrA
MSRIANHPRVPLEPTPRKRLTSAQRFTLLERQNDRCPYCEEPLFGKPMVDEHILPLELGGSNDLSNRALLCVPCAKAKTKDDHKRIAKARRLRKREAGENKRSRKIAGKPLGGGPLRRKMSGEVVPR